MKKIKNLEDYINEVSINWFEQYFLEKVENLKLGFLDNSEQEIGDFTPDIGTINYILSTTKKSLEDIKNLKDIKDFIEKYSFNLNQKANLQVIGEAIQSEIIETLNKNPNNIQEKITEIIIKMQVSNIIKNINHSIDALDSILSKIGEDTAIGDVDFEDIKYIIDINYKFSLDKLKNWSKQNPLQSENYQEELEILISNKDFFEKKKAVEIIGHYFNSIIGLDIEESEFTQLGPKNLSNNSKIVIYNKGIMICDELSAKVNLISYILENNSIFK